jgi:hypothetical protein
MLAAQPIGRLESCVLEIQELQQVARFKRQRVDHMREVIRESDALLELVEDCRIYGWKLIPKQLWHEIAHFVGSVDVRFLDRLGINRALDHVNDILFEVQQQLFAQRLGELPRMAEIIPLFREEQR